MTNRQVKEIVMRDIEQLEKDMTKDEFYDFIIELNHCVKESGLKVLRKREIK